MKLPKFWTMTWRNADKTLSTDSFVWFVSCSYFCANRFQKSTFWKSFSLNLFIDLHIENFTLSSSFFVKKLTPMAAMYQVRYPSVSGTGAGWRNLELSPLPLSNDQYVFNKRRYHQPQELCHWAVKERIMLYIYQIFMVKIWLVGWSERWIYFKICSMFKKSWSRIFEDLR